MRSVHGWRSIEHVDDTSWHCPGCRLQRECDVNGIHWSPSQVALMVKNLPASVGNIRDAGSIPGWGRSHGGGHDNPLQYSCLENPMDGGAWWAIAHGVSKSRTRLRRLSTHSTDWFRCDFKTSCSTLYTIHCWVWRAREAVLLKQNLLVGDKNQRFFFLLLKCFDSHLYENHLWESFLKSLLNLLWCGFCFLFWFFGCKACGILALQPWLEPTPCALEGEVLTPGLPGKTLILIFKLTCTSFLHEPGNFYTRKISKQLSSETK